MELQSFTGLTIKPIEEIKKWNTKRILSYKNRLHKHLSYIQTPSRLYHLVFEEGIQNLKEQKEYLTNLIYSIKEILKNRENV